MAEKKIGKVYLVGSGPGDDELITLKGIKRIQQADVIVYDWLANNRLLRHSKKNAEIIYVGKRIGHHTFKQKEINELLVEKASAGSVVTRLKGGDPFVFGRGGEEALYIKKHNIPYEVVPGVTSAISVPSYAGIPVTLRGLSSSVAIVTGHEDPKKKFSQVKWAKIADSVDTLIILMGVANLSRIAKELIKGGLSPDKDAALIQWGSTPSQKIITGKLHGISEQADKEGFTSPSVIVIGDVVGLREKLNWFECKPLFGKKVMITRPEEQADEITQNLVNEGAEVVSFPLIKIMPPNTWKEIDERIKQIKTYDWMVFTSVNGARYFFQRFFKVAGDIRNISGVKISAIGSATEKMINDLHLNVSMKPEKYTSQSLIESFSKMRNIRGKKFLLPRAQIAGAFRSDELRKMGAVVDDLICYRTVPLRQYNSDGIELLKDGGIDAVTFTSSSTVHSFVKMAEKNELTAGIAELPAVSIGPETTKTAREYGFNVKKEAGISNMNGLFTAVKEFLIE